MDRFLILYRLSSYRRSRATIDTQFEMGVLAEVASAFAETARPQVKDSQYLQKYKINTSHIRVLFLTFIWKFAPDLITKGYIYAAVPPLYKATVGKDIIYLKDDAALEAYRKTAKKAFEVNRHKGLGEMDPHEMAETVMNPETRTLKQITMDDIVEVAKTFIGLMGEAVGPRKTFIEDNAWRANVDV